MNAPGCRAPLPEETLLAYWLGELDAAGTDAVDTHLLGCDACGSALDALVALGDGVRRAFDAGLVGAVVGAPFVARLAERGLRVREYRVAPEGSVDCHIAPDDDLVVSRLALPALAGATRLDLLLHPVGGGPVLRAADVPFDAAAGELVAVVAATRLRTLPSGTEWMRIVAVDGAAERVLGEYRFNHHAAAG